MIFQQCAYLAGLLDGDGSIMLQIRPRQGMKFLFRVKTVVVIYQDTKQKDIVEQLWKLIGAGYFYHRNDHISEIRIEGFKQVKLFLTLLKPYLLLKKKQADLMLRAISLAEKKGYSIQDFLQICAISDEISACNYSSKKRKYTSTFIISELKKHNLFPVTTGSLH